MCDAVLAGDSLRSLCTELERTTASLTVTGKQWSTQTLRRLLDVGADQWPAGTHGEIVAKAEWPAIITPRQTRAAARQARRPGPANEPHRPPLSAGALAPLFALRRRGSYSRPRADGSRRYVCASGPGFGGCGKLTVMADPFEAFVVEAVLAPARVAESCSEAMAKPAAERRGKSGRRRSSATQAQLDELADDVGGRRNHSQRVAEGARRRSRSARQRRKKRLAALNRTTALLPFVGDAAGYASSGRR